MVLKTAVQAQNGLIVFNTLILAGILLGYTCMFSNYKRTVVLCAECILAGGS